MEERSGRAGTSSGVGIEECGRGKYVDGKPKWMKEIVDHEDEDDEFGEEGFKDAGVDKRINLAHLDPTVDLFSSDPIPTCPVSQQHPLSQRPSQPRIVFDVLNHIFIHALTRIYTQKH